MEQGAGTVRGSAELQKWGAWVFRLQAYCGGPSVAVTTEPVRDPLEAGQQPPAQHWAAMWVCEHVHTCT